MAKQLLITQDDIDQKVEFHTNALKELGILQKMLDAQGSESPVRNQVRPLSLLVSPEGTGKITKQAILLGIVDQHPEGISTREIIAEAHRRGLTDYSMKNVSPKLSAYCAAQLLTRRGPLCFITEKGKAQLRA
jgi:hypothetical protein